MAKKPRGFKAVILPDVHINDRGYNKVYDVVKRFIAEYKPDKVYLLGDFADASTLSHWNLQKRRACEGRRHRKEIEVLSKELDFLQRHSKEVIWLEGNHENWVEQYIDKNPESEGLLEYPELLDLEKRGIQWVPYNKLLKVGKLYMTHGRYASKYHAAKHADTIGSNIVYCHTHMPQTYGCNKETTTPYMAYCLGCLCGKSPSYLRGKQGNWIHGFATLYVADNGEFNLYPINIISGRFYYNERRWD